jgi:hypothetical protein
MFAVQDDDDTSHPERIDKLVKNICRTNADVVFSDLQIEAAGGRKTLQPSNPDWLAEHRNYFVHAGSHVGLWRTSSLRRIGGYYGGFRIGADTVVVGLMSGLGRPSFLHEALYCARRSERSMTRNSETGMGTPARQQAWSDIHRLWRSVLDSNNPISQARILMQDGISIESKKEINVLTNMVSGYFSEG